MIWLLAIQGLFLGVVILRKETRNPKSNRLIAGLLFIFFLACVGLILKEWKNETAAWIQVFPFYHLILVGPIIYLFLRSELEPGFQPSIKDRSHFIVGLWSFRELILPSTPLLSEVPTATNAITYLNDYGDVLVWLVITSYLVLGLTTYKNYKSSPRSLWLKQFLDLFLLFQFAIWLPVIALHISPYQFIFEELGITYEWVYVPFTLMIYWIGIKWFYDAPTLTFKSVTKRFVEKRLSPQVAQDCIEDLQVRVKKYGLFRHPQFALQDLAQLVSVSETTLDYLLHQEMGKTFEDFMDGIRVDQVLADLEHENRQLTFDQIVLENGFETVAAGTRAIQSYTTMSKEEIRVLQSRRIQKDEPD